MYHQAERQNSSLLLHYKYGTRTSPSVLGQDQLLCRSIKMTVIAQDQAISSHWYNLEVYQWYIAKCLN